MEEALVTDPEAARLLTDPTARRYLEPFMAEPRETAVAARVLGVSVETMAHRVGRLRRAGLLHAVSERRHAGRAVVTWAAARSFRCPLASLPEGDVRTAFDLMDRPGREAFLAALVAAATGHRMLDWDLRVSHADGRVQVSVSPGGTSWLPGDAHPSAPPVVLSWLPLRLTDAQADELQQRLLQLTRELPIDPGSPTHLAGLFLTPLPRAAGASGRAAGRSPR